MAISLARKVTRGEEAPALKKPRGGTIPVIPDERQISFLFLKLGSESETTEHYTTTHASINHQPARS